METETNSMCLTAIKILLVGIFISLVLIFYTFGFTTQKEMINKNIITINTAEQIDKMPKNKKEF